ncbi:caspase domain-containing protein [Ephemerocybe angulata]|uniref:Caspase domain-containing protein n=1 Tax=Ephemerocybe angulata TaxID=980116 RepID=A0A8H6M1Y0_9AGAR|nr:caspase domain-containing protein [Tulosesus angulatus]
MVIPIYDDTEISQALMGPTVIAHASDSRSTYGHHGGKHHRRDSYEYEGTSRAKTQWRLAHPTGRHSDDSKQSHGSDHAHHQNHHEHQPHSPTSPSSPPYDRPFDAPHHNNSSNSHPPKRPALAYQSTQTPLEAPSPKKPSSSTNVLQDMKARHDAFHEAVRNYFKLLPPNPNFCRSCCSGRKRALCIGINYLGQKSELQGCANDARAMRDFLIQQYHFSPSEILLLTDDDRKNKLPTREEMFKAMAWLVAGAKKDDSLFFHYSGHGGQVKDEGGRELDGMDEDIFPVDHAQAGDIIDDDLNEALVQPLPAGCRLTSCHSGTHSAHGRLRSINHISKRTRQKGMAPSADVICFSACKDDETAADTFRGDHDVAVGAMSHVRPHSLTRLNNKNQTYDALLGRLREILIPKYHQKAQISCTIPLELDKEFTL